MTVDEIMTTNVRVVEERASIGEAMEILAELEIRHLPVVRGGEIVGMISDRDLRGLGVDRVADLESLDRARAQLGSPVAGLMSSDVLTVSGDTDVGEVIDLMLEEKVGALPVVDEENGELLGIVSYVDILRAARDII